MKEPTIFIHYKIKNGKKIASWRYMDGITRYSAIYESNIDLDFIIEECKKFAKEHGVDLNKVYWADPFLDDLYAGNTHCVICERTFEEAKLENYNQKNNE